MSFTQPLKRISRFVHNSRRTAHERNIARQHTAAEADEPFRLWLTCHHYREPFWKIDPVA